MRLRKLSLTVLALTLSLGAWLSAAGPTYWTLATSSDFLRGTSDGVYVSLSGVLTPGPPLSNRLTTSPAQIWSLATAADGTLWAGTGGDGRVIRLRPGQPEETVYDSPETNVFAIAIAGSRVYAATSPDGKVYAIESDGTTRTFFDPQEKYIWALAVDRENRLWVGAGNPAVIYRVDANGTSQVVYRPPASHVVSLALDASGRMLAGTESPGRLYRFDAADHPFVLLDSGMTEVVASSTDASGVTFAAAVTGGDDSSSSTSSTDSSSSSSSPAASSSGSSTSSGASVSTFSGAASASTASGRSVLFRIAPDGTWEDIWSTTDIMYDVAATGDGGALVATGPNGRLYKVTRDLDVQLLTGVDAKNVTRFSTGRGGVLMNFATASPGRVIAVGTGQQSPATYLSPVRDSKSVANWGLLRWDATAPVALSTRSGNTDTPDDSWSAWSAPYTHADGEAIASPAARFLQWRAVFTSPGTAAAPVELTSVTVAYLPRNSRPEVSSITVYPPGVVFQRPFTNEEGAIEGLDDGVAEARRPPGDPGPTASLPGRRMFQKGLQAIAWKGDDDDGDELRYSLQYRLEGESTWRDLEDRTERLDVRLGHDVRPRWPLYRPRPRVRQLVECRRPGTDRNPRERSDRSGQYAADDHGDGRARRRPDTTVGRRQRRAESDCEAGIFTRGWAVATCLSGRRHRGFAERAL